MTQELDYSVDNDTEGEDENTIESYFVSRPPLTRPNTPTLTRCVCCKSIAKLYVECEMAWCPAAFHFLCLPCSKKDKHPDFVIR